MSDATRSSERLKFTYSRLKRPDWAPPAWVFGAAWTVIYLLYIVAGVLALPNSSKTVIGLYLAGWVVNLLWLLLFRNQRVASIPSAVNIATLLGVIIALASAWYSAGQFAAATMTLPYIAWLCIALVLTIQMWQLNRK